MALASTTIPLASLSRLGLLIAVLGLAGCSASAPRPIASAGGPSGWSRSVGGAGGRTLHVTNLHAAGPGSLQAALATKGARLITFDVAGVIDLGGRTLQLREPYVTIAGESAPDPGITLIRGGLFIRTHDVIVRHLRVRPGSAGHAKRSGWEVDGLGCGDGAVDVVIDHCSFTWATDENIGIWGEPFRGATPEEWHRNNPHRITLSHNLIAEGLDDASHRKGPHSKGLLIGDNSSEILVYGNLFLSNVQRNPEVKGGATAAVINNLIVNPGSSSVLYHMPLKRWRGHPFVRGRLALIGNVLRHGPDTRDRLALFRFVGVGDLDIYAGDNLAHDRNGRPVSTIEADLRYGGKLHPSTDANLLPPGLQPLPAASAAAYVLQQVGARPWERDTIDARLVQQAGAGTGRVIDSEADVGGYPAAAVP